MYKIAISIILLILISCQPSPSKQIKVDFKDSVLKRYLAKIDSLDFYDTLNRDYRTLKAYINNDTGYFIRMNKEMDVTEKYIKEEVRLDTCVHLVKLSDLPVDEAYRFFHDQSFCDFGQRITITRSGKSIQLHYIEYGATDNNKIVEFKDANGIRVVGPGCRVERELTKKLTMKEWEKLEQLLYEVDYWGLKPYHYDLATDGSSWQIEAFTKRPIEPEGQQTHFVSRHCSCNNAFKQLGNYFLKLSGEKTKCGEFF